MAKNRIDMPLDYFVKNQSKSRQKHIQAGKTTSAVSKNSFKLKRKRQHFINNQNKKGKSLGSNKQPKNIRKENGLSLARRQQEKQNKTISSGKRRNGKISMQKNVNKSNKIQNVNNSGVNNISKIDNQKPKKLFTKSFDARKKIEAKRQAKERRTASSAKNKTKAQLNASRQQQRDAEVTKKRELSLIGGKMQIVSRIKDEEERKTLFTGDSLRVTKLQSAEERRQSREAMIHGDNTLLIRAANRDTELTDTNGDSIDDSIELSEYALFEARRKAEAERVAATEHPKLSSLHPISRPKRSTPVFHQEEDNSNNVNTSTILVTNLHPNVSTEDIYELFSAVGPLSSSRILRSGVAEVIYKNGGDAVTAYRKYNGRNLDGQPMICKVAFPEQQIYQPPPRAQQLENKSPLTKPSSSRPVIFTVKI